MARRGVIKYDKVSLLGTIVCALLIWVIWRTYNRYVAYQVSRAPVRGRLPTFVELS